VAQRGAGRRVRHPARTRRTVAGADGSTSASRTTNSRPNGSVRWAASRPTSGSIRCRPPERQPALSASPRTGWRRTPSTRRRPERSGRIRGTRRIPRRRRNARPPRGAVRRRRGPPRRTGRGCRRRSRRAEARSSPLAGPARRRKGRRCRDRSPTRTDCCADSTTETASGPDPFATSCGRRASDR
jgi:hypothetical protein